MNADLPPRLTLLKDAEMPSSMDGLPEVLIALDQFPPALGGGERVALRLASLLPQYGFRPSILTMGVSPQSSVLTDPAPCPIYLLPIGNTYGPRAITGAIELRRFLKSRKIVIVQTFFESSDLWVGGVTKLFSGAKLIWSRRDLGILRAKKHEIAYRMMSRLPDAVFAVSEQVKRHCIEVDHIPADRVETVYNGIDLSGWTVAATPDSSRTHPVIATVGNIRRVKGHDLFIRAAATLAQEFPSASFVIAGEVLEQEYYAELKALIGELGLETKVQFAGAVTNLARFLGHVDLFVLPSRSEGFSNAIIEAMAAGLPVVATNVGGNAEAVADQVTGLIVPAADVDALAGAIRNILTDPSRMRAMGLSARERVAERFTVDAMMKQITATYRRVLRQA